MISPPTECPCCNSTLVWKNDQLYCINVDCGEKQQKAIEHFASTLKIKGLGPSTIKKLGLYSILDIYDLTVDVITELLGSNKLAIKLFDEIENSKKQSLNTVLAGLGIPLIGNTATNKLSLVCDSIFDINESICKKAGLGEKATNNLMNWLEENEDFYLKLPMDLEFKNNTSISRDRGVICISGKLSSYTTKQEATNELLKLGYEVKSSLTKDVTILVNESGKETQKTQKARESGILIIDNLKNFIIGDNN